MTHWSCRTLAKSQGVSKSTIHNIWQAHNLKPHRVKTFKLSRDPKFLEKLTDVIGLYLTSFNFAQAYPDPLRRVSYFDAETNKRLKFLTNNFTLPALTIAQIYKSRWQVELFFKWIKQHLRIKSFYGTSENAVKTQIWIAVSIYVLIAIVRKRLGLEASLYQILQIFSVTLFEKMPILQALQPSDSQNESPYDPNQLILFDF